MPDWRFEESDFESSVASEDGVNLISPSVARNIANNKLLAWIEKSPIVYSGGDCGIWSEDVSLQPNLFNKKARVINIEPRPLCVHPYEKLIFDNHIHYSTPTWVCACGAVLELNTFKEK